MLLAALQTGYQAAQAAGVAKQLLELLREVLEQVVKETQVEETVDLLALHILGAAAVALARLVEMQRQILLLELVAQVQIPQLQG